MYMERTLLLPSILSLLAPAVVFAQPCSGSIDLGPDVALCDGQTVLLTPGPGFLGYLWDNGTTGPSRMVGVEGTYWCTVQQFTPTDNLVVNGDFSAGSTGFTSGYVPGTGGTWGLLSNEGQYAVAADASDTHNNFPPCTDHTGGGNMMVVNGSATAGVSIWCQSVTVQPGTNYAFSAWLSTIIVENPAVLQFTINGQVIGDPFEASFTSCQWDQFYQLWNSGTSTTADICITNQNTFASGNDFALDDISFTPICTYTDTVSVTVSLYPEPEIGPDRVICGDDPVVLDATMPEVDTYIWNDGLANTPQLEVTTSGVYWVNVFTGTCGGRDSVNVTFIPQPTVDLGPDRFACTGDSVALDVSGQAQSYLWQDGSTAPTWATASSTEAWVQVSNGPCVATDSISIVVGGCGVVITMPNVFTPNGDPQNGQFKPIVMEGVSSLELEIFNRWGQVVYTSKLVNFSWDGRTGAGEKVPDGTYYWIINYQGPNEPGELHGSVTLLR